MEEGEFNPYQVPKKDVVDKRNCLRRDFHNLDTNAGRFKRKMRWGNKTIEDLKDSKEMSVNSVNHRMKAGRVREWEPSTRCLRRKQLCQEKSVVRKSSVKQPTKSSVSHFKYDFTCWPPRRISNIHPDEIDSLGAAIEKIDVNEKRFYHRRL